jgi:hypothetical protein
MTHVSEVIHGWLGWCPNEKRMRIPPPDMPDFPERRVLHGPDTPGSGRFSLTAVAVPRWMTAVAIVILSATPFTGGSFWWPVFVMTVIIAFTIILCRDASAKGVSDP